jgi:hypothetical protein
MPTLVFPAPGCASGQRIVHPFAGFDILSSSGGAFVNLLKNSVNLSKIDWIRGSSDGPVTANYDIVDWYQTDADILPNTAVYILSEFGDNLVITNTSSAYLGQVLSVTSNTTYTASFFAKRGTATGLRYSVYDYTNSSAIVSPTSYYNQTTSTFTKISFSFVTGSGTSQVAFYPIWTIDSGQPGSVYLAAPQVQTGSVSGAYDATTDVSFAALGVSSILKQSYGVSKLGTFSDPAKDFDPIHVVGQNKVKWNVVNDYLYDNSVLGYSSLSGNTTLEYRGSFSDRPYKIGDTVTIAGYSPSYRQNFTVTSFTTSTLTINTTTSVPRNGALIVNPNPTVYPSAFEYLNLLTYKKGVTQITSGRQELYLSSLTPNVRSTSYFIDGRSFADSNISSVGRLTTINVLKTTPREYLPGKAQAVIKPIEVSPGRLPNKIQSFTTATGFLSPSYASVWPSGIYKLSYEYLNGIVLYIGTEFQPDGFATSPQFENVYRLESFDDQGIYVGPVTGVTGTDNIKPYDAVAEYINDYTFTASTYVFPYPGYLYFNPIQTGSLQRIQFPLGSYVKISNTATGYSEVTMVLESNLNNILVTLAPEFPNNYLGGTTIQDASPFYYPKEQVAQNIGHVQLPIENIELPRENLFYSEYRPLIPGRAIVYSIDRAIGNDTIDLSQYIDRMETFQDIRLPGDFILPVTGQNSEIRYAVVSWYTNESDILTRTSATSIVKTIYFPVQGSTVYASSSTVRIRNASINYDKTFSVITGTNYSVTILDPDDFPSGSLTTIEQNETSVYPQRYVNPTINPINARENLYYFNLAPGYRSNSTLAQGKTFASTPIDVAIPKLSSVTKLKTNPTRLTVDKLSAAIRVKGIPAVISSSTFVNKIQTLTSQTSVRTLLRPVTPAERLFYFTMAPGYLNNSTYSYGKALATDNTVIKSASISNPIVSLRSDKPGVVSIGKLRSMTAVKGDSTRLQVGKTASMSLLKGDNVATLHTELIQPIKFKFDTNQVFFAPESGNITKQIAKLTASYEGLPVELLGKTIAVIKDSTAQLQQGKLRNITDVKAVDISVVVNLINRPIVFRNNQIFETPYLGKVKSAIVIKDTTAQPLQGKLKTITDLKSITVSIETGKVNNPIVQLGNINNVFQLGNLNPIVFLNNQVFETPYLGKVTAAAKLRDIFANISSGQLSKQISILTGTVDNRAVAKLSFISRLKEVPQLTQFGAITKFKFSVLYSQVFSLPPVLGKVAAAIKVKADGNKLTIGKTTSINRLKDTASQFFDTGITDNYFDQTNYAAITVPNSPAAWYRYFNIAPGFRASLTYQQGIAVSPDYATLKTDKLATFDNEGLVTDPYLDIIGSTDPIVSITGRTNQFTNDVVLWYIQDRDVLTLLPVGSPTLTLYFRAMSWTTNPFSIGQRVRINNNTVTYGLYATVLSADATSITIVEPPDFPSISNMTIQHVEHTDLVTVYFTPQLNKLPYPVGSYVRITNNLNASYITVLVEDSGLDYVAFTNPNTEFALPAYGSSTIASASVTVYPKTQVRTTVAPTRSRENLYYAELAGGYRYGVINTPFGFSISENSFNLSPSVSSINPDSIKLIGISEYLIPVGQLRKQLFELRLPTDFRRLIAFVDRFKLEADRIHEIQLGASNGVIRILKTGDYKPGSTGIIDVAAPKKEPIQFWN